MAIEWNTVEKVEQPTRHTLRVRSNWPSGVGTERSIARDATREDLLKACEATGLRAVPAEPVRDELAAVPLFCRGCGGQVAGHPHAEAMRIVSLVAAGMLGENGRAIELRRDARELLGLP